MELAFYSNYLLVDLSVLEAYCDIYAEISEMLRTPTNTACGPAIFFPWAAHFHCAVVDIYDVLLWISTMCTNIKSTSFMPLTIVIYFQFALLKSKVIVLFRTKRKMFFFLLEELRVSCVLFVNNLLISLHYMLGTSDNGSYHLSLIVLINCGWSISWCHY